MSSEALMEWRTYLRVKVVCYSVTRLSSDSFGIKRKLSIFSNLNLDACSCCRRDETGNNERDSISHGHIIYKKKAGLEEDAVYRNEKKTDHVKIDIAKGQAGGNGTQQNGYTGSMIA